MIRKSITPSNAILPMETRKVIPPFPSPFTTRLFNKQTPFLKIKLTILKICSIPTMVFKLLSSIFISISDEFLVPLLTRALRSKTSSKS